MTGTDRPVLTFGDLAALPVTVDLMTAARTLGIGRTTAYAMARAEEFPCPLIRVGGSYRVPTAGLLRLLGLEPARGAA
ncbi:helix-turn-helix domain-containing protein [Actinokineospora sp. NBRC 105648]|uniref:helix-turn-helix domain-containing protein n=1 Tax=Actinokineospora sp. NBRC 105648 TaxID=3032206 RepID=UPI0024A17670|nr:helix-turn-helix domain-containing protein [Actinokineospora sp. NBRC 105648]GLZ37847.1 integrase [Actinokineospora sp. NBRC 105648]